jgi:arylformamidase
MKIWDIARTLSNDCAEWPGDEPFHFRLTKKIAKRESENLGAITMSVHNGTHADARFHFDPKGESIEKAPLNFIWVAQPWLISPQLFCAQRTNT